MKKPVWSVIQVDASDRAQLQRVQPEIDRLIAEHLAEFNKRCPRWRVVTQPPTRGASYNLSDPVAFYWRVGTTFLPLDNSDG